MRPLEKDGPAVSALINVVANAMLFGGGFLLALIFFGPSNASLAIPVIIVLSLVLAVSITFDVAPYVTVRNNDRTALPPSDVHFGSRL